MDRNNSNDRTTAGVIAATAIIATIALLALAGLGGVSCAAEGENAGGSNGEIAGAAVSAVSVTDRINYQGRLTDSSGSPLTGTYTMTFGLYEAATGRTVALAKDTHAVDITDGLFSTGIDFDRSYFDGRALWLGVTVGTDDEMTPRQEFRPVPYALSLVPGAEIIGSAPVALYVESVQSGMHLQDNGIGVYGKGNYGGWFTTNQGGTGGLLRPNYNAAVNAATTHDYSNGVRASTTGDNSNGVRASTTGDNSDAVHAYSANSYGVYGKGKYGGYFTTNQGGALVGLLRNPNAAVNAATTYNYSDGVRAHTTGYDSDGVYAYTTGASSHGVRVHTTGSWGDGVRAYSDKGNGVYGEGKYGGYFTTNQGGTFGLLRPKHNAAVNAATTYNYSDGVRASTTGSWSTGVHAETTGVESEGVYASTTGAGSDGVYTYTTGSWSTGVHAETTGIGSRGVYAKTTGDYSDGVYANATGAGSDGVHAYSDKGNGVFGETSDSDSHAGYFTTAAGQRLNGATVYAHNSNSHGIALYARNDDSDDATAAFINGGTGYLIKGFGGDGGEHEFAVHNDGKVWTAGGVHVVGNARVTTPILEITGGSDLSEQYEIRGIRTELLPSPGMVVSIDPENPGDLVVSNNTYDRRVAGIISGAGGIKPGMLMGQSGSVADGGYPVALTGRVYCWADASNSPIEPGDMLTTSDTPGHAMKVTDYTRAQGAVLGKAMSSLDEGRGLVLVLVTLQ